MARSAADWSGKSTKAYPPRFTEMSATVRLCSANSCRTAASSASMGRLPMYSLFILVSGDWDYWVNSFFSTEDGVGDLIVLGCLLSADAFWRWLEFRRKIWLAISVAMTRRSVPRRSHLWQLKVTVTDLYKWIGLVWKLQLVLLSVDIVDS